MGGGDKPQFKLKELFTYFQVNYKINCGFSLVDADFLLHEQLEDITRILHLSTGIKGHGTVVNPTRYSINKVTKNTLTNL